MKRSALPTGPWISVAADLLGTMPTGEYLFVVVDYYSRYFEVDLMKRVRATDIIASLETLFARYGAPYTLITDNGPQFTDSTFNEFLKAYGVEHSTRPPLWPRANGEVERQNRTLLRAMQIAQVEGRDWRKELMTFLLAYRTTPHSTTGVSPGETLFQRKVRCKLPVPSMDGFLDGEMRDRDLRKKEEGRRAGDIEARAHADDIEVGDKVLVQQQKTNKLVTTYEVQPYDVIDWSGAEVTVSNGERTLRRHVSHTRRFHEDENENSQQPERRKTTSQTGESLEPMESTSESDILPGGVTRPKRERRPPGYLEDYVR